MMFAALFAVFILPLANAVTVSYDPRYGDAGQSLNQLACSDGPNGLESKGYYTLGALANFPYVGGVPAVASWNSPACGTCWALTYNGKTVHILAVDVAVNDYNISPAAMNDLTNGQATFLGRVPVAAQQVDKSLCKL